nr:tetrahydromethanopterin S-methyltransferase subunit H [Candidatus Baldrarchaeota archaeon]
MIQKFPVEQKVYEIGGVKFGGQPGEYPPVLIGSIFFKGHKIVFDSKKGVFDKAKAKKLVENQEKCSSETGCPHAVDVIAETPEAMKNYLSFIFEITDAPILVDSPDFNTIIEGCRFAIEIGEKDRIIYNSLGPRVKEEELKEIQDLGINAAVLLALNTSNPFPDGTLKILEETLLPKVAKAGITKPLIDTPILDLLTTSLAIKAIDKVKSKLGLPCGCAPCNASFTSRKIWPFKRGSFRTFHTAIITAIQLSGANFIIYGPIRYAPYVFPACAAIESLISYGLRFEGIKTKTDIHPLKIFVQKLRKRI